MKVCITVAEFNLFHMGHSRLALAMSSHCGEDAVRVALMSGNFVQRGEPAVLDKYTRAEIAVRCGFDLVLELPFPWSCSGAEFFASGAVSLAADLSRASEGHKYSLVFGSESGDRDGVFHKARNLSDERYLSRLEKERREKADRSESDIRMRSRIYEEIFGEPIPRTPNDILGAEYVSALLREGDTTLDVLTIKREGDESATRSREYYRARDFESLSSICPIPAVLAARASKPISAEDIYPMLIPYLLSTRLSSDTDGMTNDLAYRFTSAARRCKSFSELIEAVGTKKYTDARLRRTLILGHFGITTEALSRRPSFTVVLGAGARGREFLSQLRRAENGPRIITAPSELEGTDGAEALVFADMTYAAASGRIPSEFLLRHPFIN